MTLEYIKSIFEDKHRRIPIGFNNPSLLVKTERLLLDNGYKWGIYGEPYRHILRDDIDHLLIYINYGENNANSKTLSIDYSLSLYGIQQRSLFMMTDEIYNLLKLYFSPIPDYKPKFFAREI
jgi:hypothetical protein